MRLPIHVSHQSAAQLLWGASTLLKVSHDGMSCEITKIMQIPMNTLCYLIKLVSLFHFYIIYSPFVALSIFAALSNFCRIIKLLPSCGFGLFFIGVYISLMISQDIPSCETFSKVGFIFSALQLMYMDLGLSLRVKCISSYAILLGKVSVLAFYSLRFSKWGHTLCKVTMLSTYRSGSWIQSDRQHDNEGLRVVLCKTNNCIL